MLRAQLTALCDEQLALLSRLAFGRNLSHGVDLAVWSFSLTTLVALRRLWTGYNVFTSLAQKHGKKAGQSTYNNLSAKSNRKSTSVPILRSRAFNRTIIEYRHEVGTARAYTLTSWPRSSFRRGQRRFVTCN